MVKIWIFCFLINKNAYCHEKTFLLARKYRIKIHSLATVKHKFNNKNEKKKNELNKKLRACAQIKTFKRCFECKLKCNKK